MESSWPAFVRALLDASGPDRVARSWSEPWPALLATDDVVCSATCDWIGGEPEVQKLVREVVLATTQLDRRLADIAAVLRRAGWSVTTERADFVAARDGSRSLCAEPDPEGLGVLICELAPCPVAAEDLASLLGEVAALRPLDAYVCEFGVLTELAVRARAGRTPTARATISLALDKLFDDDGRHDHRWLRANGFEIEREGVFRRGLAAIEDRGASACVYLGQTPDLAGGMPPMT